jgi:LysR family hca operon transcriptional activator
MELRHLRYFVAVAEEGSLTAAAEQRLFTSQPSLSRQIQALEDHVGTALLIRSSKGIELTAAGKVFLDHARVALVQVETAAIAARQAAAPSKPNFALGFLTGQEMQWLPQAMRVLGAELPKVDITVSSQFSPGLAADLVGRKLDVAFMRREANMPELAYQRVATEPLMVVLPSDHRLAAREAIAPAELLNEKFIGMSATAPVLRNILDNYFREQGLHIQARHEIDNLAMAISMVASTRGLTLLPSYALNFLPWSVVSRPLTGAAPTIELVIGYRKAGVSPLLRQFIATFMEMIEAGPAAR